MTVLRYETIIHFTPEVRVALRKKDIKENSGSRAGLCTRRRAQAELAFDIADCSTYLDNLPALIAGNKDKA